MDDASAPKATGNKSSRPASAHPSPVQTYGTSRDSGPTDSESTEIGTDGVQAYVNPENNFPRITNARNPEPEIIQDEMDLDATSQDEAAQIDAAADEVSNITPNITLGSSMFPQLRKNVVLTPESRRIQAEQMKKVAQMHKVKQEARRQAQKEAEAQDGPAIQQEKTLDLAEEDSHDIEIQYRQARREYTRRRMEKSVTPRFELKFTELEKKFRAFEKRTKNPLPEDEAPDQDDEEDEETNDDEETLFVSDTQKKRGRNEKAKGKCKAKSSDEPPAKKQRSRPAGKKNGKAKSTTSKSKKGKKSTDRHIKNVLQPSNIFDDVEAAQNLAEDQPGFDIAKVKGNRERALKDILTNVTEHSKKAAMTDKHTLNSAIKDFTGTGSVKPASSGRWLVKGMHTSLTPHQILGTGFMRHAESKPEGECRGGILADQMGLGKTLMALANCVNGRPDPKTINDDIESPRATLIVVTSALMSQWVSEIDKHVINIKRNQRWGIHSYYVYREREGHIRTSEDFQKHDLVLTTYSEVAKSWPVVNYPAMPPGPELDTWMQENFYELRGILHRTHFLRVILDEAHMIRNMETRVSSACCSLSAEHKWAMTGTPMVNGAFDLYALFRFIGHPHVSSMSASEFKRSFVDRLDPMSTELLNDDLTACMSRATHRDQLFGARLVNLPKTRSNTVTLTFTRLEREIYNIVHERFKARVKKIVEDGQTITHQHSIWVLILRLRQLTSHPLMVQGEVASCLELEDFARLDKLCESENGAMGDGKKVILRLRNMLAKERTIAKAAADDGPDENYEVDYSANGGEVEGDIKDAGRSHGKNQRFSKYLSTIKSSETYERMSERTVCTACNHRPHEPVITSCFHVYCQDCLTEVMHESVANKEDRASCMKQGCNMKITTSKPIGMERGSSQGSETGNNDKTKKKADAKDEMADWLDMAGEPLPSTKTMATKAQILNWWDKNLPGGDPETKVIVFSQWRPMILLLSKMCQTEQWGYCTLTGDLTHKRRDEELSRFRTSPDCRILIASLKCGSLGLNLTCASKVIIVDPWWNEAVEQQAFCRVFRIGQMKETEVVYLSIKDSIDERLSEIKSIKTKQISEVMLDHKTRKRMKMRNLLSVFGKVEEGVDGQFYFTSGGGDVDGEQTGN